MLQSASLLVGTRLFAATHFWLDGGFQILLVACRLFYKKIPLANEC